MKHTRLEILKMNLAKGTCETFNQWKQYGAKEEDFLAGCEWLFADPLDEYTRCTRGLGVERNGEIKRLFITRGNERPTAYYEMPKEGETLGRLWSMKPVITASYKI